jgi:hypothetical protein
VVKRARKAKPSVPGVARGARPIVATLVTLGVAGGLLFGLSLLGDEARRNIGPRDRYAAKFADIRCDSPPGLTRETFLTEVRYASNAPHTIQTLDPQLQAKLTTAFGAHPWVASVDAVSVEPPGVVNVKLTFRKPVLTIRVNDTPRAVDAKGVLLPATASTAGLPELLTPVQAPEPPAGQPWPDAKVQDMIERAASVAAEYKPKTVERTEQGWLLVQPNGQILLVGR